MARSRGTELERMARRIAAERALVDTVDTGSWSFPLGSLECLSLSDGSLGYPPGHIFAHVPRAQIEEALRQYNLPIAHVTTPCTCLFVRTGEHRVLVDLGAGRLAPGTGRLRQSLAAAGIEPADIDTVLITHAHPAHVGGTFDSEGRPVYSHACYYMSRDEWEFWTSEAAFARASERHVAIARANLEPIRDRLTLLDREGEIVPGIRALLAPGHTPGHMAVWISSAGERLLYLGDAAMHPLQLEHPDWSPIYDVAPEQAQASRRRILGLAAEDKALVMGHHLLPFPGLGNVVKAGEGWHWQPIVVP